MRIKEVALRRFKRFTDTIITDIPDTARLVIIAGPNGCGKSSFFEALNVWARRYHRGVNWDASYYVKFPEAGIINHHEAVSVAVHGNAEIDFTKAIYIRSAYRNDPTFQIQAINRLNSVLQENRLNMLIENDATVSSNYQRLAARALEDVFEKESANTTVGDFREKVIGEIRDATIRLFPDLVMNSLGNPLTTGTFKFDKGASKGFLYKNLSGGEKAAFDLLLDIFVKRREFNDTVFCIDEPETHMNTRLQAGLLDELYRATAENCQLWLATHSIGMMRRARDLAMNDPSSVVFLDFGGRDFDLQQLIVPEAPNGAFWKRVLSVAFDDFAELIAPREVIICEGRHLGAGGPSEGIDAKIYEVIFAEEFPDTRFIPGGNSHDVAADRLALISAMEALVRGTRIRRLIDRDDMSSAEVEDKARNGVSVLRRRHLESYLFDDDVIRILASKNNRADLGEMLVQKKAEILAAAHMDQSRRRPLDDVKASAGPIMQLLKKELSLSQSGGTVKEFMRSTLAPLVSRETSTYQELRDAVFSS